MPTITDLVESVTDHGPDDGRGVRALYSALGRFSRIDEAIHGAEEEPPQRAVEDRELALADTVLAAVALSVDRDIDLVDAVETRLDMAEAYESGDEEELLRARFGDEEYEDIAEQLRGTAADPSEHDGVGFQ